MRRFHVGAVTLLACFFVQASFGQEATDLKKRFLAEAAPAWEQFVVFSRTLQGSSKYVGKSVTNGREEPASQGREEFRLAPGGAVRVNAPSKGRFGGKVLGANPQYVFELKRESPDNGWVIAELTMLKGVKDAEKQVQAIHDEVEQYGGATCLRLWNLWLPTLIRDPDFRVLSVRPFKEDNLDLAKVEFEYPKPSKQYPVQGGWRIAGGWFIVDPGLDWVVREFELYHNLPNKAWVSRKFAFRKGTGGHPIVTWSIYKTNAPTDKYESSTEVEYNIWEEANLPIEECTVSAFGLPEPPGVTYRNPSRWYLWFIGIAAVSLAIGAFFWRRASQGAKMPSANSLSAKPGA